MAIKYKDERRPQSHVLRSYDIFKLLTEPELWLVIDPSLSPLTHTLFIAFQYFPIYIDIQYRLNLDICFSIYLGRFDCHWNLQVEMVLVKTLGIYVFSGLFNLCFELLFEHSIDFVIYQLGLLALKQLIFLFEFGLLIDEYFVQPLLLFIIVLIMLLELHLSKHIFIFMFFIDPFFNVEFPDCLLDFIR